jgi:hypothetical protein
MMPAALGAVVPAARPLETAISRLKGREEGVRVLKALFYLLVSSNESVARLARRLLRLPA